MPMIIGAMDTSRRAHVRQRYGLHGDSAGVRCRLYAVDGRRATQRHDCRREAHAENVSSSQFPWMANTGGMTRAAAIMRFV